MAIPRRSVLITAAAALAPLAKLSRAQDAGSAFPNRTIRIVHGFAVGGGTDLLGRFWAPEITRHLGQSVVVEAMPGASGLIATNYVRRAAPDGYTLLLATPAFTANPVTMKDATYDVAKDFQPIIKTLAAPMALVVPNSSPVNNVRDLIAMARARPGELSVGTLGYGSAEQVAAEMFKSLTSLQFTEIPYKGAAPALVDLMAGRTQLQFEAFPSVMSYIKAGTVKTIAVTSKKRSPLLPNIPTMEESGVPGFEYGVWNGFLAPAGTPRPVIDKLNGALQKSLADPAIVAKLGDAFGSDPAGGSPEDFAAFLGQSVQNNDRIMKRIRRPE